LTYVQSSEFSGIQNTTQRVVFAPLQTATSFDISVKQNNVCGSQHVTISIQPTSLNNSIVILPNNNTQVDVEIVDVSVCSVGLECANAQTGVSGLLTIPLTVDLPSVYATNVTFDVEQTGGGSPVPYNILSSNPVEFSELAVNGEIKVQIDKDDVYQPTRYLAVSIQSASDLHISANKLCSIEVPNTAPLPSLFFSYGSRRRSTNNSGSIIYDKANSTLRIVNSTDDVTITLGIELTNPSYQPISFTLKISGSAQYGADFTAPNNTVITDSNNTYRITPSFTPYSTYVGVAVVIRNSNTSDAQKVMYLDITNVTNAAQPATAPRFTIRNMPPIIPPTMPPTATPTSKPSATPTQPPNATIAPTKQPTLRPNATIIPTPLPTEPQAAIVDGGGGLNPGELAGLIIGVLIAFILLALLVAFFVVKRVREYKRQRDLELVCVAKQGPNVEVVGIGNNPRDMGVDK
jgi:hypothetical protein